MVGTSNQRGLNDRRGCSTPGLVSTWMGDWLNDGPMVADVGLHAINEAHADARRDERTDARTDINRRIPTARCKQTMTAVRLTITDHANWTLVLAFACHQHRSLRLSVCLFLSFVKRHLLLTAFYLFRDRTWQHDRETTLYKTEMEKTQGQPIKTVF